MPRRHPSSKLVIFIANALSLLIFYTLTVLVLRYAFDIELPNPLKDWRHYFGRIPPTTVSEFDHSE
jgi:hypothetical protein